MNWDIVEGNWKQLRGKVQARWGDATRDRRSVIIGRRIQLAGRIQESYGFTKEEDERQIKDFQRRHADVRATSSF